MRRAGAAAVGAVAPDTTLIVTDGFSCREMIAQETDRRAVHFAQVLQMALESAHPNRSRVPGRKSPTRTWSEPLCSSSTGCRGGAGGRLIVLVDEEETDRKAMSLDSARLCRVSCALQECGCGPAPERVLTVGAKC